MPPSLKAENGSEVSVFAGQSHVSSVAGWVAVSPGLLQRLAEGQGCVLPPGSPYGRLLLLRSQLAQGLPWELLLLLLLRVCQGRLRGGARTLLPCLLLLRLLLLRLLLLLCGACGCDEAGGHQGCTAHPSQRAELLTAQQKPGQGPGKEGLGGVDDLSLGGRHVALALRRKACGAGREGEWEGQGEQERQRSAAHVLCTRVAPTPEEQVAKQQSWWQQRFVL